MAACSFLSDVNGRFTMEKRHLNFCHQLVNIQMMLMFMLCIFNVESECSQECSSFNRYQVQRQWAATYTRAGVRRRAIDGSVWGNLESRRQSSSLQYIYSPGQTFAKRRRRLPIVPGGYMARCMAGLNLAVSLLHDPQLLTAQLDYVRWRHSRAHVPSHHFAHFKEALLRAMSTSAVLRGVPFQPPVWNRCLEDVIKNIVPDGNFKPFEISSNVQQHVITNMYLIMLYTYSEYICLYTSKCYIQSAVLQLEYNSPWLHTNTCNANIWP